MNIGRYMLMMITPTIAPTPIIISGSMIAVSEAMAASIQAEVHGSPEGRAREPTEQQVTGLKVKASGANVAGVAKSEERRLRVKGRG